MRIFRLLITLLLLQGLAGCLSVLFDFGDDDPHWQIPIVSKTECKSLEGEYLDDGHLFWEFNDGSIDYSAPVKFSTPVRYPTENPLRSGLELDDYNARYKKFYATAYVKIQNVAKGLEATLYGGDGLPYAGRIIAFDHPNVGCDVDGNLVLRELSRIVGGESPSVISTTESVFYKEDGGVLKVHRQRREWLRTTQSVPVRVEDVTLDFPPHVGGAPANPPANQ